MTCEVRWSDRRDKCPQPHYRHWQRKKRHGVRSGGDKNESASATRAASSQLHRMLLSAFTCFAAVAEQWLCVRLTDVVGLGVD